MSEKSVTFPEPDKELPFGASAVTGSNPDSNGYVQTYTYYKDSARTVICKVVSLTYDSKGNVLSVDYTN